MVIKLQFQGGMSDEHGRKRMLLLSYSVSSLGYFSLAFSNSVVMLALSRIPNGSYTCHPYSFTHV